MGKAACFFVVLSFDLARSQMVLLCHLMIGQPELGSESGPGHIHFTLQLPSFRSRHPGTAGLLRARLCSIQYLCPLAAAHQMPRTSIQPTVAIQRASCQLAYAGRRKGCRHAITLIWIAESLVGARVGIAADMVGIRLAATLRSEGF